MHPAKQEAQFPACTTSCLPWPASPAAPTAQPTPSTDTVNTPRRSLLTWVVCKARSIKRRELLVTRPTRKTGFRLSILECHLILRTLTLIILSPSAGSNYGYRIRQCFYRDTGRAVGSIPRAGQHSLRAKRLEQHAYSAIRSLRAQLMRIHAALAPDTRDAPSRFAPREARETAHFK
jgi:hypothetical protein